MKKHIFTLLITLSILLTITPNLLAINGNMGGPTQNGSADLPYLIQDFNDFQTFCDDPNYWAENIHMQLDCNLNLDPNLIGITYSKAPISSYGITFSGNFDGNSYIISNLTIDGDYYCALFGTVGSTSTIKDLGLENVSVTGTDNYIGSLVSNNEGGSITSCYSTGFVTGDRKIGGLIGENYNGCIINCYSTANVDGNDYVGGLVGNNYNGSITNCYAIGEVICSSYDVGGLVGESSNGSIANCFWDVETSGIGTSGDDNSGATGKTTLEMQTESTFTYAGWDFVGETANGTLQIWQMPTAGGYPVLTSFNGYIPIILNGNGSQTTPYLISNSSELGAIYYYNPTAFYKLTSDIHLTGIKWSSAVIPYFNGHFDGDCHTIYNLDINGNSIVGLFGKLDSHAIISDLNLENTMVSGSGDYVGSLVGYNYSGSITNCYLTGAVTGSTYVGSLIGENYFGNITNCYSTVNVIGSNYAGGLIGNNYNGSINICYSTADVNGLDNVGGLVGKNFNCNITNCYATGKITGFGNVGGLIGNNDRGYIANCYSTGFVNGFDSVGGLVGDMSNSGSITDCNAIGEVTGSYSVGGLVGEMKSSCHLTNCYAIGEVNGSIRYIGGLAGKNSGNITNCYTVAEVTGLGNNVGGLVGDNNGNITDCYSTKNVTGSSWSVGGLVGENGHYGHIVNCYSTGEAIGNDNVGGLVGVNYEGNLSNCYSIGAVTGSGDRTGGVIGLNSGHITNCYSIGTVTGSGNDIGGLIGRNYYCHVTNCYSKGTVTGANDSECLGGLFGSVFRSEITNCFWDIETSGMTDGFGCLDPQTDPNTIIGKTTAEMKTLSTFTNAGWDFIDTWNIGKNQTYPFLRKYIAGDVNHDSIVNFADFAILANSWLGGVE